MQKVPAMYYDLIIMSHERGTLHVYTVYMFIVITVYAHMEVNTVNGLNK